MKTITDTIPSFRRIDISQAVPPVAPNHCGRYPYYLHPSAALQGMMGPGMRRRLFAILTAISTVGLAASLASWCITRQDLYLVKHRSASRFRLAAVRPLGIYVAVGTYQDTPLVTGWTFERQHLGSETLANGHFGFALNTRQGADQILSGGQTVQFPRCTFTLVLIPFWAAIASTAVLPTVWLWRLRRRKAQGLCDSCGYDLRASSERCPECGRSFEAAEPPGS